MKGRIMKNQLVYFILVAFLLANTTLAQDSLQIENLEKRIKVLEERFEQTALEKILEEAEKKSQQKKEVKSSKTFKSGQRSLQAINPEISLTGDAFGQYIFNNDKFTEESRSGAHFRVVGLHIQSSLDPFSMAKVAIEFTPSGVEFGEAYMTWTNFLSGMNLTAGKFRQQFGVVNRWHAHALDQFDFPLALQTILGEEGLNQMGISLDWFFSPIVADANNLTLEITNGQNGHLFSGDAFSFPAVLSRFKNYFDLTPDTYLEFGLSGMIGSNNFRGYIEDKKVAEATRYTKLAGVDLTLFWEPVNKAKYNSFLWRSELYYADKDEVTGGNISALGGYSYTEYRLNEYWQFGTRFDYTQPFQQKNTDLSIYQIVPYITWWQSHWVRMRLQYNFIDGKNIDVGDNILRLQLVWAVGPHKHDRY